MIGFHSSLQGLAVVAVGIAAWSMLAAGQGAPDPWSANDLIRPDELAKMLEAKNRPAVFYVGFPVLYRSAHIPEAKYFGATSKDSGLEALRAELAKLPKTSSLVIYCGCCPWDHCPNIRPAAQLLRDMGFKQAKILMIPTNMSADWITKGYPIVRAATATNQD